MNHKREQNLKDSKTALNGWLLIPFEVISRLFFCTRRDWQIHLDSPSYHRFWNFGMSTCLHSFCQCVENGILSWDSKKDFDPELTTLFFATPARNERSKVLWHGVPQAQLRERKVVTWSEKRWEGKMSWDDELLLVFGINVYDTVLCMAVFDIACANLVYFTMGIGTGCNESAWCYGICLVKLLPGQDWGIHHLPISQRCTEKGTSPLTIEIPDVWLIIHIGSNFKHLRLFSLGFLIFDWSHGYLFHAQCVSVWIPHPPISPETGTGFGIGTLSWGDTTLQRLLPSGSNPDFGVSKVLCRCLDVAFKSKDAHGLFWKPLGWTYHFSLVFSLFSQEQIVL